MYFVIVGVDLVSKDGMWVDEVKVLFEKLINFKYVVGFVIGVENDGRYRVKFMDIILDLDMEFNQILIVVNYGVKLADIFIIIILIVIVLQLFQLVVKFVL